MLNPDVLAVGRAVRVDADTLTVLLDNAIEPAVIPLGSIGRIDASMHRRERHIVRGVVVGAAIWLGTAFAVLPASNDPLVAALPFVAGAVVGAAIGAPAEKWKPVSILWLRDRVIPSAPA